MTKNKTTPAQLKAVRQYEKKVQKLQVVFNVKDKPEEKALYDAIKADKEPFGTLTKRLLTDHYSDNKEH